MTPPRRPRKAAAVRSDSYPTPIRSLAPAPAQQIEARAARLEEIGTQHAGEWKNARVILSDSVNNPGGACSRGPWFREG